MSNTNELSWLHISDIHFHPKTEWRDSGIRHDLLEFLTEEFERGVPRPDLVFCTGDIAFGETGKDAPLSDQYKAAATFFDELLACCRLTKDRFFMVPGNHDVNRKAISTIHQERLVEMAGKSREYVGAVNKRFADRDYDHSLIMSRLKDYAAFVKDYRPELYREHDHVYAHRVPVNGHQIAIAGFNSAWSCAGPEDDRHTWLAAEWQFNHVTPELRDAQVRIGLIHHPFDWLPEAEQHEAEVRASTTLDFLLHGHTHTAWVRPNEKCVQLAAGAIGADSPDQFGFNIVRVNLETRQSFAHLYAYNKGWMRQNVPRHAHAAVWEFQAPAHVGVQPALVQVPPAARSLTAGVGATGPLPAPVARAASDNVDAVPAANRRTPIAAPPAVFGRAALVSKLTGVLRGRPALALHGLSGNGKTTLIKTLHQQPPFHEMALVDIHCSSRMSGGELFRRLLDVLQNRREDPSPPAGSVDEQVSELRQRYPAALPAFIWLNEAHLLLDKSGWRDPAIRVMLTALARAFPNWKWVYELNEKPAEGAFGRDCTVEEVPGLDKAGLVAFFAASAPTDNKAAWNYSSNDLQALFQWLGGGHGGSAHTLAAELLITVAKEKDSSPLEVYRILRTELIDRLDERLLAILHDDVLGNSERLLLKVLALYRRAIPQDHADALEDGLNIVDAWQNLRRRGLLPLDNNKDHYLHGFIASWVRRKQMALQDAEFRPDYSDDLPAEVAKMHRLIAHAWIGQIGRQKEAINFYRANEAFYHLVCAGDLGEIESWIDHLSGNEIGWSKEALWEVYNRRRERGESITRQQEVLQLIVNIHPRDHKALRFLGESLQRTKGKAAPEALAAFEQALAISPGFPPYLANLGKALLAQGKAGAEGFLKRLETHERLYPGAVDAHVAIIKADCLDLAGDAATGSLDRRAAIDNGSRNSVFYNQEARYQLTQLNDPVEALRILDLAKQRQCDSDDYTESLRALILERLQRGPEASALRMGLIDGGTVNSVFFVEEAMYQLEHLGDAVTALRVLDKAIERGFEHDTIRHLRANTLQRLAPASKRA